MISFAWVRCPRTPTPSSSLPEMIRTCGSLCAGRVSANYSKGRATVKRRTSDARQRHQIVAEIVCVQTTTSTLSHGCVAVGRFGRPGRPAVREAVFVSFLGYSSTVAHRLFPRAGAVHHEPEQADAKSEHGSHSRWRRVPSYFATASPIRYLVLLLPIA